jgi:biotin operon repressor
VFFDKKKVHTEVNGLRDELKVVFSKIKEEFDDHLESINQNTAELQSLFEYMSRLNDKMDKLSSRLDGMENISVLNSIKEKKDEILTVALTREEEEIFAILLSNSKRNALASYEIIAQKLDITTIFVANLITSLLEKGVPIEKRLLNGTVLVELSRNFNEKHMKYNLVTID